MEVSQLARDIFSLLHQTEGGEVTMEDIRVGLQAPAVPSSMFRKALEELREAKVIVHYALKHNKYVYRLASLPIPPHLKYRVKA